MPHPQANLQQLVRITSEQRAHAWNHFAAEQLDAAQQLFMCERAGDSTELVIGEISLMWKRRAASTATARRSGLKCYGASGSEAVEQARAARRRARYSRLRPRFSAIRPGFARLARHALPDPSREMP